MIESINHAMIDRTDHDAFGEAPEMPYHGRPVTVETPHGASTLRTRLSRETLQALVDAYAESGQIRRAAERVGLTRRSAWRYLDRLGLIHRQSPHTRRRKTLYTFPPTGRSFTTLYDPDVVEHALMLYGEGGLSCKEVAERLPVKADTLRDWTVRVGLARPPGYNQAHARARKKGFEDRHALKREVLRLLRHGLTVEETARLTGASRRAVCYLGRPVLRRRPRRYISYRDRPFKSGLGGETARAERRTHVRAMRDAGRPAMDIAHALGVSVATVYNDLSAGPGCID